MSGIRLIISVFREKQNSLCTLGNTSTDRREDLTSHFPCLDSSKMRSNTLKHICSLCRCCWIKIPISLIQDAWQPCFKRTSNTWKSWGRNLLLPIAYLTANSLSHCSTLCCKITLTIVGLCFLTASISGVKSSLVMGKLGWMYFNSSSTFDMSDWQIALSSWYFCFPSFAYTASFPSSYMQEQEKINKCIAVLLSSITVWVQNSLIC